MPVTLQTHQTRPGDQTVPTDNGVGRAGRGGAVSTSSTLEAQNARSRIAEFFRGMGRAFQIFAEKVLHGARLGLACIADAVGIGARGMVKAVKRWAAKCGEATSGRPHQLVLVNSKRTPTGAQDKKVPREVVKAVRGRPESSRLPKNLKTINEVADDDDSARPTINSAMLA
jgi:hypothetical protein